MDERSKEVLAGLTVQDSLHNIGIRTDPVPHIQEAYAHVEEMSRLLDEIYLVLIGADSYDLAVDAGEPFNVRPIDQGQDAILRVNKARLLINEFDARNMAA